MAVSIKKLAENDWHEFSRVRLKALKTDPNVFGSSYETESLFTEEDWRSRLSAKDNAIFLICDDETPIGMTAVSVDRNDPSGKTALLWGSWLEPEYRGKNLSRLIYGTRIDWATAQPSVEKIIVSHRASNLSSKYANQKHGFIETSRNQKIWRDGVTEDEIFYELRIKAG